MQSTNRGLQLDGTHAVLTPEYVEFDFVLAGLVSRALAWLIDTVIAGFLTLLLLAGLSLADIAFQGLGNALAFIAWFAIDWGYMIALEVAWSGQTVGKRVLGLRVLQESGVRVGFYQSILRNLVRPIDRLPAFYLVGGIAAGLSQAQQRLGDLLAGTIVVKERRLKIPAALDRLGGETLLADPEFQRQVGRLTDDEESVLLAAAMRREELGMEARLTLFAALARRLEEELDLTRPAHLSDEKLVLLVTAALAARRARRAGLRPLAPQK